MPDMPNLMLWIEALESGDYKQGRGALRPTDDTFCCLGVACEVAIRNGVEVVRNVSEGGRATYDGAWSEMPTSVTRWLGLDSSNPDVGTAIDAGRQCPDSDAEGGCQGPVNCYEVRDAASANDDQHWTFAEIAKALRNRYTKEI